MNLEAWRRERFGWNIFCSYRFTNGSLPERPES